MSFPLSSSSLSSSIQENTLPSFSKVLPPHTFLADSVHYMTKIKPYKQGIWPLGASLRPDNIARRYPAAGKPIHDENSPESLPGLQIKKNKRTSAAKSQQLKPLISPSICNAVLKFVQNDCYKTNLNLFSIAEDVQTELMQEAWERGLDVASSKVDKISCHIPVSTVEHDNSQLVWGRTSFTSGALVNSCSHEEECDSLKLRGNQGPLQRYMSPEEQLLFDSTGTHPSAPDFCLLCIRRDIHAAYLAYSATIINSTRQLDRPTFVIPPFQNLVDCPGGYKLDAMGVTPSSFTAIPLHVCGVNGSLSVNYDPHNKIFYIDQGPIIFTGNNNAADF